MPAIAAEKLRMSATSSAKILWTDRIFRPAITDAAIAAVCSTKDSRGFHPTESLPMGCAMEKSQAVEIKRLALAAVEDLSRALQYAKANATPEEFEKLKKGVGLSIGAIEMNVMVPLYEQFPELEE